MIDKRLDEIAKLDADVHTLLYKKIRHDRLRLIMDLNRNQGTHLQMAYDIGFETASDYSRPEMSRRDYFAAAALQGTIAYGGWQEIYENELIERSVKYADALIAELDKPQEDEQT